MTLLMMQFSPALLGPTYSLLDPNILKYFVLTHPQSMYLKHVFGVLILLFLSEVIFILSACLFHSASL
jgi:hypothetical protein